MNTFKSFRLAAMAIALLAISSSPAFSQILIGPPGDPEEAVKNAVAIQLLCNPACNTSSVVIPKGYRLVITQASALVDGPGQLPALPTAFQLVYELQNEQRRHAFMLDAQVQMGIGAPSVGGTHHCFVVMDKIVHVSIGSNPLAGINLSGYLVKM